jgi:hypothetical protein
MPLGRARAPAEHLASATGRRPFDGAAGIAECHIVWLSWRM